MAETKSKVDLNNFIMALGSNAPIVGFVTPELLQTEVEAVVFLGHKPTLYRFARHGFFHPDIKDLQRPSVLAFIDGDEASAYVGQSDQLNSASTKVSDLFRMTEISYNGSCGVMFRVNGNDSYAHPSVVADFNVYSSLGGLTLLYDRGNSNLIRSNGEFVMDLNQLQNLDILLEESPWVRSYSLWLGEIEGVETTVIDIVLVDGIDFETGMSEHARLLPLCQEIVSNATVLAAPDRYFREPPFRAL